MRSDNTDNAWIEQVDETHYCGHCGRDALWISPFNEDNYAERLTDFCPYCGVIKTFEIPYGEEI